MRLHTSEADLPQKDRLGDSLLQNVTFPCLGGPWSSFQSPTQVWLSMGGCDLWAVAEGQALTRGRVSGLQGTLRSSTVSPTHFFNQMPDLLPRPTLPLGLPSRDIHDLPQSSWKQGHSHPLCPLLCDLPCHLQGSRSTLPAPASPCSLPPGSSQRTGGFTNLAATPTPPYSPSASSCSV